MATQTAVHSPAAIARAKSAALTALAAANDPKPVPDSGGLVLCPEMRLWRATEILAATNPTDPKYTAITLAVGQLATQTNALHESAQNAVAEYQRLCQAANQPPDSLTRPACECDGHKMWTAMEDTRRAALWLLWPMEQTQERYPALAVLWKAGKREYLGEKIGHLADAQVAYTDACARLGTQPQWGWVLK